MKPDTTQLFLTSYLPTVKRMIQLEEKFITKLTTDLEKTKRDNKKWYMPYIDTISIEKSIVIAEQHLTHFRMRQKQYEEYVLQNWEESEV